MPDPAVADAYDAMTSDRSYRKAMSREEAIAEIRKMQEPSLTLYCQNLPGYCVHRFKNTIPITNMSLKNIIPTPGALRHP